MRHLLSAFLLVPLVATGLAAQATLPLGPATIGSLGPTGEAARYRYQATVPGILTVAVHGSEDLTLAVLDVDGQPLADGTADRDLGGTLGAEVLAVPLTEAGTFLVEVRSLGTTTGSFTIGASFVEMPAFGRPPDPDGRPSLARALAIGTSHADELHPDAGDRWDWYVVTVDRPGTLVVITRMDEGVEGDLALEVYLDRDFSEPAVQSDQDLQGNLGHESVTVEVRAGQPMHVKVRSFMDGGGAVPYRVSVTRVP